jgi:hypothetical protein
MTTKMARKNPQHDYTCTCIRCRNIEKLQQVVAINEQLAKVHPNSNEYQTLWARRSEVMESIK